MWTSLKLVKARKISISEFGKLHSVKLLFYLHLYGAASFYIYSFTPLMRKMNALLLCGYLLRVSYCSYFVYSECRLQIKPNHRRPHLFNQSCPIAAVCTSNISFLHPSSRTLLSSILSSANLASSSQSLTMLPGAYTPRNTPLLGLTPMVA